MILPIFMIGVCAVQTLSLKYMDFAHLCLFCQDGNPLNRHLYCESYKTCVPKISFVDYMCPT